MNINNFYRTYGVRYLYDLSAPKEFDYSLVKPMMGTVWHQLSAEVAPESIKKLFLNGLTSVHIPFNVSHGKERKQTSPSRAFRKDYIRRYIKNDRVITKKTKIVSQEAIYRDSSSNHNVYLHEASKLYRQPNQNIRYLSSSLMERLESMILHCSNDNLKTKRRQLLIIDLPDVEMTSKRIRFLERSEEYYRYKEAEPSLALAYIIEISMFILNKTSVFSLYEGSLWDFDLVFDDGESFSMLNLGVLIDLTRDVSDKPDDLSKLVPTKTKTKDHALLLKFLNYIKTISNQDTIFTESEANKISQVADAAAESSEAAANPESEEGVALAELMDKSAKVIEIDIVSRSKELKEPHEPLPADKSSWEADLEVAVADKTVKASSIRVVKDLKKHLETIPAPWGNGESIAKFAKVTEKDLEITKEDKKLDIDIRDPSLAQTSLKSFDKKYIEEVLHKDIASVILSMSDSGIYLQNLDVQKEQDAGKSTETYQVKVKPVDGNISTLSFTLPSVSPEGTMFSNGTLRRMKKQWSDIPIKKTKSDEVLITSAPGKLFINRVKLKAKNESSRLRAIIARFALKNQDLVSIKLRNVFDKSSVKPDIIENLGLNFEHIRYNGYDLQLNDSTPTSKAGRWAAGSAPTGKLVVDKNNTFYSVSGSTETKVGSIYDILDFVDYTKIPVEFAEIKILGKKIPIAIPLLLYFGINNLIKACEGKVKLHPSSSGIKPQHDESIVRLLDVFIIMKRNSLCSLVLSGLSELEAFVSKLTIDQLNSREYCGAMIQELGLAARHENEMITQRNAFLDPMTKRWLLKNGYPDTLALLLIRAVKMLLTKKYLADTHSDGFYLKGYERVPRILYKSIYGSIREYNNTKGLKRRRLSLNSKEPWMAIMLDKTVHLVNQINPVHESKEISAYTLTGEGGRSKEAIVEKDRAIHPSAIGMISEASVDSGDAGISRFLPFDPSLTSLDGSHKKWESGGVGSVFSIGAASAPFSNKDYPPRAMFSGVQQSHCMPIAGAHQPIIRTGAEEAIVATASNTFIKRATGKGVVVGSVAKSVMVHYDDDTKVKYSLGTKKSITPSVLVARSFATLLKTGSKVKAGDAITFCSDYFEENWIKPGKLIEKRSSMARTSLLEIIETEDDSSIMSEEYAKSITTNIVMERKFQLSFSQPVSSVVEVGAKVDSDSVIYIMSEPNEEGMTEKDREVFGNIANLSPKADFSGTIIGVDVLYNGNIDDMCESIKLLTLSSNRRRAELYKEGEASWPTGKVSNGYITGGKKINEGQLELIFSISVSIEASSGDKIIVSNQGKSVSCDARTNRVWTDIDDQDIELSYSNSAFIRRNITSAKLLGSTNSVCIMIAEEAVKSYRKSK